MEKATEQSSNSLPKTYVKGFHDDDAVRRMKYSALGNTGIEVSALGFGASPFDGGYNQAVTDEDCTRSLRAALTSGINYIDTAPWYGRSEEVLGKALKGIPREAYYIATKVGRYKTDITKMFDFTAEKILSGFDESLRKLGLDYVDVIQVHDLEFAPSPEKILNEALPAVRAIQQSGRARFIGITGYPVKELKNIYLRSTVKIDSILSYCHLCLNDSSLLEHVPFMEEKGVALINASPLSMGLLTPRGPPTWHPAPEELRDAAAEAVLYCQKQGVDLPKLAMSFTLSQESIPVTLVGMSSVSEVERNLSVLHQELTAKEKEVQEYIIKNIFGPVNMKSWEGREVAKYWKKLEATLGEGK